jgi:hypothetical protein
MKSKLRDEKNKKGKKSRRRREKGGIQEARANMKECH